ncbi:hypothetical protein F2Q69_00062456 [Brassica cretica]|uniref:Uncharacterized protein n=1 Tax=Brassica cretica TaxID=69181 RepID=A0A8S9RH25_BRACR|nr:hypothetical protein F2Q69_00062456 [Brassica cretica]
MVENENAKTCVEYGQGQGQQRQKERNGRKGDFPLTTVSTTTQLKPTRQSPRLSTNHYAPSPILETTLPLISTSRVKP